MYEKRNVYVYGGHWQTPAKTEMAAYESLVRINDNFQHDYLAFPWATLIDALDTGSSDLASKLLGRLRHFKSRRKPGSTLVSVCQHIKCLKYISIFRAAGVTHLFWPHKVKKQDIVAGVRLFAFPLFPAQTNDLSISQKVGKPSRDRKLLTNFIGSYGKGYYLSDVRPKIFQDIGKYSDIKIIERKGWHFGRDVYERQMKGEAAKQEQLKQEESNKNEYLELMGDSKFTLCPTGSGPNSIRIFESIQLRSIPVILTEELDLIGEAELWNKSCIVVEDSPSGYESAIQIMRSLSHSDIQKRLSYLERLVGLIDPCNYGAYISSVINKLQLT